MSDDPDTHIRETLNGTTISGLLALLPGMGKVMVIGRSSGVTHERIGPVESVTETPGGLHVSGACHDALIQPARVGSVVLDTGSQMGGKVFPRLDFLDAQGEVIFSVVGMEGLEPFTYALKGIARETAAAQEAPEMPTGDRPDLDPADPVHQPFAQVQEQGDEAVITFDNGTLRQSWRGRIETLRPAMGFLNVMTSDFHLHLKGGTVSGWQAGAGQRVALDDQARPNVLTIAAKCLA